MTGHPPGLPWEDAIAARAGCDVPAVRKFLERHRIRPSPILPSPKSLVLRRIRFTGVKDGIPDRAIEPIDFDWDGLGPGLWVIGSPSNLAGKSSILEVTKWLLRGQVPSTLRTDVHRWIRSAELRFDLGGEHFAVEVTKDDSGIRGRLTRDTGGGSLKGLASFASDADFAAVMSAFMMERLSLDRLMSWQKSKGEGEGTAVENGWPALSSAMSIGVKYEALLGDIARQGLSGRLLSMYIGLPWVSTLTECVTALGSVNSDAERGSRRVAEDTARRDLRVKSLEEQLQAVRQSLSKTESNDAAVAAVRTLSDKLAVILLRSPSMSDEKAALEVEIKACDRAAKDDYRAIRDYLEDRDAGMVFGGLEPVCCPKCEITLGRERELREIQGKGCRVCGEVSVADEQGDREPILKGRHEASVKALKAAKARLAVVETRLEDLGRQRREIEHEMAEWARKRELGSPREGLLLDEQRLLARIEEAGVGVTAPAAVGVLGDDVSIAKACEEETRRRSKETQDEVLREVGAEILVLARSFGMQALTSVELRGNATMPLVTGSTSTSYSAVTEGEKLRLKVATAIAIMSVGQRRGIGRHPGLLLVDSPAAQEVSAADLDALMAGLASITTKVSGLQVIMATKHLAEAAVHVDSAHTRNARVDGTMW